MGSAMRKEVKKVAEGVAKHFLGRNLDKDEVGRIARLAAARAAFSVGMNLYSKPGVNANIQHLFRFPRNSTSTVEQSRVAGQIHRYLKNIRPQRLAIDGLPGSGKSTLARELARQMNMEYVCLDHNLSSAPECFDQAKAVFEHHRLLRTQDLDPFDALLYLDEPLAKVEKQILGRGRGAAMIEAFDFERMRAIGQKAFEIAKGEVWRAPDTNILVKRRPEEGFQEWRRLRHELKGMGLTPKEDMPKEALLFMAVFGKAKGGSLAYLQSGRFLKEVLDTVTKAAIKTIAP
ncbi:hypothetical protein ACFL1X_02450 [Candidatus Hydrogenedentota bacterium]